MEHLSLKAQNTSILCLQNETFSSLLDSRLLLNITGSNGTGWTNHSELLDGELLRKGTTVPCCVGELPHVLSRAARNHVVVAHDMMEKKADY